VQGVSDARAARAQIIGDLVVLNEDLIAAHAIVPKQYPARQPGFDPVRCTGAHGLSHLHSEDGNEPVVESTDTGGTGHRRQGRIQRHSEDNAIAGTDESAKRRGGHAYERWPPDQPLASDQRYLKPAVFLDGH
jgi:hypothetical protein